MPLPIVVVLATGGTIAGRAGRADDVVGYVAATLGVDDLLAAVPGLGSGPVPCRIEAEQVAQIDSRHMGFAVWTALARRAAFHLARADVAGVVVTHGTDTLEETAYFLHRVLAPGKPLVLTAAMRPATALLADGPQNLVDAVRVATAPGTGGVVVAFGGDVFGPDDIRKAHPHRLAAFTAGDGGVLARVEDGRLRRHRDGPRSEPFGVDRLPGDAGRWPWVEIVHSHVEADDRGVRALLAAGVDGLVVAGSGNGTVHRVLEAALVDAAARGVPVLRASRCLDGAVIATASDLLEGAGALTPVKARIELLLRLLANTSPGGG